MKHPQSKLEARYKPAIAREGIVLVLAPVLLSTCLLMWVFQAWSEEGRIAYQVRKNFEAASHGAKAMTLLGKAIAGHIKSASPADLGRENLARANKEVELCKAATKESDLPQPVLPIIDRLAFLCAQEASAPRPVAYDKDATSVAVLMDLRNRFSRFATIIETSQSLQEVIEAELLMKWASQDRAREHLRTVILFFLGSILAMALLLTWRFLNSIVNRLNTLTANAQVVGSRDKALSMLPGSDELAYLNAVLIASDRALKEAEAERQSILEMVAHDMRSPLMAAQITLQIVEEVTSLPVKPREQLSLAQGNLKGVLGFIINLLDQEKAQSASQAQESAVSNSTGEKDPRSFRRGGTLSAFGRPGISHKILGMVLLPLCLQASMLGLIGMGMLKTERLDNIGRSKSRLAASVVYGVDCLFLAETRQVKYLLTNNSKYKEQAREALAKYRNWIKDSCRYITGALDKSNFDAITSNFLLEMNRMESFKPSPGPDGTANLALMNKCLGSAADPVLMHESEDSASEKSKIDEKKLADSMEKKEREQRLSVQRIIYLFVPVNIVVAFLLILFFTRGITKRLDVIVDHARKLSRREPIVSTVTGDDELSYLDKILQQTCADLIESEESRRAIMHMIAHDMRAPMIAARSAIEELGALPEGELPAVGRKNLVSAQKNIDLTLGLVDDLFTVDRLIGGRLELNMSGADVREIADRAISALSSVAAKRGINLVNDCRSASIAVDVTRINQVLINFISNAIKFSPDNSVITLVSRSATDSLEIGVKDQGPGMDKDTAARVFEKFFQAEGKRKAEGFGLGLSICKLIVESHGGEVYVETAPAQGATFWIRLPRL